MSVSGRPDGVPVRIIVSERRTRTISGRFVSGTLEVRVPVGVPDEVVSRFVTKLRDKEEARRALGTGPVDRAAQDEALHRRALALSRTYFGGLLIPARVQYVTNQATLHGSCSVRTGEIRVSHRLAAMPSWVRDYVLVHEIAHLQVPSHSRAFWRLVARYPLMERARGFLMGAGMTPVEVPDVADPEAVDAPDADDRQVR
ncbi:MAG: M48 family peptidase [Chloroflexi bacterium]|nr:MAG: M48 family peptidase [Chloroflexota bacterium]